MSLREQLVNFEGMNNTIAYIFWFKTLWPCGWKSLTIILTCRTFSTNSSNWFSKFSNGALIFKWKTQEIGKVKRRDLGVKHSSLLRKIETWKIPIFLQMTPTVFKWNKVGSRRHYRSVVDFYDTLYNMFTNWRVNVWVNYRLSSKSIASIWLLNYVVLLWNMNIKVIVRKHQKTSQSQLSS